jgi:hypothetical protein
MVTSFVLLCLMVRSCHALLAFLATESGAACYVKNHQTLLANEVLQINFFNFISWNL